jgi:3-methylcrotonyl-CoA carboxylase alpha subunit
MGLNLRVDGVAVTVDGQGSQRKVRDEGGEIEVEVRPAGPGRVRVIGGGRDVVIWVEGARAGHDGGVSRVEPDLRRGPADLARVRPPMPGTVTRVYVAVGDAVELGAPLVGLTAMKTELVLRAPKAGIVTAVRVRVGDAVSSGDEPITVR